jgi:ribonuclease P protein component
VGILRSDDAFIARIGIITSRRVGGAVIRSKVRRRLREIIRVCRESMSPGASVVIVAKSAAATATFEELKTEWLLLARRLSILPSAE